MWGNDTDNDKGTNTYIIYCITDTIIYPLRHLMMCEGGLISESFSVLLHPPKDVPNRHVQCLFFRAKVQDSELVHFLEDGKTF